MLLQVFKKKVQFILVKILFIVVFKKCVLYFNAMTLVSVMFLVSKYITDLCINGIK